MYSRGGWGREIRVDHVQRIHCWGAAKSCGQKAIGACRGGIITLSQAHHLSIVLFVMNSWTGSQGAAMGR